jgi:hypothetical protein
MPSSYNVFLPLLGIAYVVATLYSARDVRRFRDTIRCLVCDLAISIGISCAISILWLSSTSKGGATDVEFTRNMLSLAFLAGPLFIGGIIARVNLLFKR